MLKRKVLFLIKNFNVGGTEKALINMIEEMDKNLFDIEVRVLEKKGGLLNEVPDLIKYTQVEDYSEVKPLIMNSPLSVVKNMVIEKKLFVAISLSISHMIYKITGDRTLYYKKIISLMKSDTNEYDVSIAYSGPFDFLSLYVLENTNAKEKIQWIHFDVSKFDFNLKLAKKNYPLFNKVIVVSNDSAKSLKQMVPTIENKIEVINNFLPKQKCINKSLEFNAYKDEVFKILTVGRLTTEKGQEIIPLIVKKLLDMGYKDFKWYVVGDGNQRKKIESKIKDYCIQDYVELVGMVLNPYPYYKDCDLYVQTSFHEGFCITIAEALLFDKFVISTDVAGAYDQINIDNGVIIKRDVDNFSKMISNFMKAGK